MCPPPPVFPPQRGGAGDEADRKAPLNEVSLEASTSAAGFRTVGR
ncbi:hypothetical protein RYJ27_10960 [Microbacterium limosum]|uniref:Uncharacterized protein n=1 Tax=Microbacterium limosum TaxID=3079935 RepID=A0AAU0MFY5_9MICO|nr:hypothetical protein [Microbacterium sp. Y20]WOQ69209.1 hypothetical protein RYJ27_10960 [Microbacterium sp. Y20]